MDHPYQQHPLELDLSALERAAWQRGDYPTAALLGALEDMQGNPEPEELEQAQEETKAAERRVTEAENAVVAWEGATDKAHDALDKLRQRIELAKRVSDREEILADLAAAMAFLEVQP